MRENEGSIYQGAASCNESYLIKECFRECVLFSPPCMYENSEYEQSFSQKKTSESRQRRVVENCHFSDLPKGHPPKKNNFGPYRIFRSAFFRISVESWKSRDLHFWGRCFKNTKPKKNTMFFFPGTKMLLLDVFGWSDRWAQRDVIESILKKK